jgi:hypothetical protein
MRLPSLSTTFVLAALPAAIPPAEAASITGSQLGIVFCAARLNGDMTPLKSLMTEDLAKRIADAESKNADFVKAHPGEKAPLADGIPWQSNPTPADNCLMVGMSGTYDVPVDILSYTYADPAKNFSDRLELNFVNGELRLDNVDYANGGDLKSRLAAAFPDQSSK